MSTRAENTEQCWAQSVCKNTQAYSSKGKAPNVAGNPPTDKTSHLHVATQQSLSGPSPNSDRPRCSCMGPVSWRLPKMSNSRALHPAAGVHGEPQVAVRLLICLLRQVVLLSRIEDTPPGRPRPEP